MKQFFLISWALLCCPVMLLAQNNYSIRPEDNLPLQVNEHSFGKPVILKEHPISQPFSIIELLEPMIMPNTGANRSAQPAETFGFDIANLRSLNPALICTETVWVQRGKNNQTAISKERVNHEQLIPVLVAALQQQRSEIAELKVLLIKLQEQIAGERKN